MELQPDQRMDAPFNTIKSSTLNSDVQNGLQTTSENITSENIPSTCFPSTSTVIPPCPTAVDHAVSTTNCTSTSSATTTSRIEYVLLCRIGFPCRSSTDDIKITHSMFTLDDQFIVTCCSDFTVRTWKLPAQPRQTNQTNNQQVVQPPVHSTPTKRTPSRAIASSRVSISTHLRPSISLRVHTANIRCLARHPFNREVFVSAGKDGRIVIWNIQQGTCIRVWKIEAQEVINNTMFQMFQMFNWIITSFYCVVFNLCIEFVFV
jgi:WD40 repeat protein